MARATALRRVNGRHVSARSKTGDPACSAAMSAWKTTGMTPAVAATLGKCRSMARAQGQAKQQRAAGNEGRAQVLERRASRGLVTKKDRGNAAEALKRERRLQRSAAHEREHGPSFAGARSHEAQNELSRHRERNPITTQASRAIKSRVAARSARKADSARLAGIRSDRAERRAGVVKDWSGAPTGERRSFAETVKQAKAHRDEKRVGRARGRAEAATEAQRTAKEDRRALLSPGQRKHEADKLRAERKAARAASAPPPAPARVAQPARPERSTGWRFEHRKGELQERLGAKREKAYREAQQAGRGSKAWARYHQLDRRYNRVKENIHAKREPAGPVQPRTGRGGYEREALAVQLRLVRAHSRGQSVGGLPYRSAEIEKKMLGRMKDVRTQAHERVFHHEMQASSRAAAKAPAPSLKAVAAKHRESKGTLEERKRAFRKKVDAKHGRILKKRAENDKRFDAMSRVQRNGSDEPARKAAGKALEKITATDQKFIRQIERLKKTAQRYHRIRSK